MGNTPQKPTSAALQATRAIEAILGIARSEHARATVTGGRKPHIRITKDVTTVNDMKFRSMLSGIEYATHGHFDQGVSFAGYTEWILKTPLIDVTIRATEGAA